MSDQQQLWFVVETEEVEETMKIKGKRGNDDVGGGFGEPELVETVKTLSKRKRVSLDAQAMKAQMSSMLAMVDEIFSEAQDCRGLQLEEVTLSVEINAEGKISIVGSGGSLSNYGGITLKFTRPQ